MRSSRASSRADFLVSAKLLGKVEVCKCVGYERLGWWDDMMGKKRLTTWQRYRECLGPLMSAAGTGTWKEDGPSLTCCAWVPAPLIPLVALVELPYRRQRVL